MMKKIFIALNTLFLIASLTCTGCEVGSNRPKTPPVNRILKIKIIDDTYLHYYKNAQTVREKTITDPNQIKAFQVEFDSMKQVQNINIKYTFGYYDITLYFDDGAKENIGLIYTVYGGVIIYNYDTNTSFKNDQMEQLVRSYFN